MKDIILEQISAIEQHHRVRVLYACESGSRAWGFASPDSDFDVRFIYVQPRNHYLSIQERKDVIELPANDLLDINGWDIRKALQLFLKSNGPLYEWLQSPIVYKEVGGFAGELKDLIKVYFSGRSGGHHYFSMARNTYENDLQGEQVKLKRYFYGLRSLLACMWLVEKGSAPPMEFHMLRTLVEDPGWHLAVDNLLKQKKSADEKTLISPVNELQLWMGRNIVYYKEKADALPALKHDTEQLDELFRKYIDLP